MVAARSWSSAFLRSRSVSRKAVRGRFGSRRLGMRETWVVSLRRRRASARAVLPRPGLVLLGIGLSFPVLGGGDGNVHGVGERLALACTVGGVGADHA